MIKYLATNLRQRKAGKKINDEIMPEVSTGNHPGIGDKLFAAIYMRGRRIKRGAKLKNDMKEEEEIGDDTQ